MVHFTPLGTARPGLPAGESAAHSRQCTRQRGKSFDVAGAGGDLRSALLWEGRVLLNRVELHWPNRGPAAPPQESVEVRVYPGPFGWFGWQADQRVTIPPAISQDGSTWVYQAAHAGEPLPTTACLPPKEVGIAWGGVAGSPHEVDMVAVFVRPHEQAKKEDANERAKCPVPQIRAYGPERWNHMDVEIEWGFKEGSQKADYDGRIEGFFGLVGGVGAFAGRCGNGGSRTRCLEISGGWRRPAGDHRVVAVYPTGRRASQQLASLPLRPSAQHQDHRLDAIG